MEKKDENEKKGVKKGMKPASEANKVKVGLVCMVKLNSQ